MRENHKNKNDYNPSRAGFLDHLICQQRLHLKNECI